jgi:hypothetical protein
MQVAYPTRQREKKKHGAGYGPPSGSLWSTVPGNSFRPGKYFRLSWQDSPTPTDARRESLSRTFVSQIGPSFACCRVRYATQR